MKRVTLSGGTLSRNVLEGKTIPMVPWVCGVRLPLANKMLEVGNHQQTFGDGFGYKVSEVQVDVRPV